MESIFSSLPGYGYYVGTGSKSFVTTPYSGVNISKQGCYTMKLNAVILIIFMKEVPNPIRIRSGIGR